LAEIGILVNPQAGGVRRDPKLPTRLQHILGRHGELVVAGSREELPEIIRSFRARKVDVLGVVGGDGSNLHAITAATNIFNGDLPPLAMLRGGSVNTVGRAMGLKGTPESLLRRLMHHLGNGGIRTVPTETMRVNDLVAFVFGGALVGKFYDKFYQGKGKGLVDAGRMVGKAFFAAFTNNAFSREMFSPVRGSVRVDGKPISFREFTLLIASTIDNHLGVRVTYRAKERPGQFHLVASGSGRGELIRQFPKTLVGWPMSGTKHFDGLARSVEIELEAPSKYIIDGDLYEGAHIRIEQGPRLQLVHL
jgi:diacylglycerol kinase family enzyme